MKDDVQFVLRSLNTIVFDVYMMECESMIFTVSNLFSFVISESLASFMTVDMKL